MSFIDRLKQLIATSSKSDAAFARECGIANSTIASWFSGTSPSMVALSRIAESKGVSLDWLITGRGEMMHTAGADPELARLLTMIDKGAEKIVAETKADFTLVPRLSVEVSAGSGAVNHTEEPAQMLAFRAEWLHRLGVSAATARALTVRGDSMVPTLQHGDIILVDTAIERVFDAGIYVVGVDDRVLVKRIQPRLDGSLSLISENPVYSPEEIPAGMSDKLRILGRVRWYGRCI